MSSCMYIYDAMGDAKSAANFYCVFKILYIEKENSSFCHKYDDYFISLSEKHVFYSWLCL